MSTEESSNAQSKKKAPPLARAVAGVMALVALTAIGASIVVCLGALVRLFILVAGL